MSESKIVQHASAENVESLSSSHVIHFSGTVLLGSIVL